MKIQLNTDKNIEGTEALARDVEGRLNAALERFADQITRIEVHLSDESGPKTGGDDKRCMIEARLAGRQPVAVTHEAPTVDLAIHGGVEKITHMITSTIGKLER
jgi:ribosome-associated translation inhibitor RaiA